MYSNWNQCERACYFSLLKSRLLLRSTEVILMLIIKSVILNHELLVTRQTRRNPFIHNRNGNHIVGDAGLYCPFRYPRYASSINSSFANDKFHIRYWASNKLYLIRYSKIQVFSKKDVFGRPSGSLVINHPR